MRNQILSVEASTRKKSSNSKIEITKIARFFAIIMIIFSLGFIGVGAYAIVDNNDLAVAKPKIEVIQDEDKLDVTASSERGIDRIVYSFNGEQSKSIYENSIASVNEIIDVPVGNNSFEMVVYDSNGKSATYKGNYVVESKAPQLSLEGSNGKLKVTAKDNEEMLYITYRWDDEEEVRVDAKEDSIAQIEEIIDIPKGEHVITVVAVNNKNLTTTKEQNVKGVTRPTITVVQDADDAKNLIINVYDDEAVKKIEYTLNGVAYMVDLTDYTEKAVQFKQPMVPGENLLNLTATNAEGATGTFEGTCTYTE